MFSNVFVDIAQEEQWNNGADVLLMENPAWRCWGGRESPEAARAWMREKWGDPRPSDAIAVLRMALTHRGLLAMVKSGCLEVFQNPTKYRWFGTLSRQESDSDGILYSLIED